MNLIQVKDYKLEISPEAYMIVPLRKIWERDRSPNKTKALGEFGYLYFMNDFKSDFIHITDDAERHRQVVKYCMASTQEYTPDELMLAATEVYRISQDTMTMQLFDAAKIGVNKIKEYIKSIDLMEKDDKGKPVYNAGMLHKMIQELGTTVDSIEKLENKVKKDLQSAKSNTRGSKEKAIFEDGAI
jgi:hypothetical protein